MGIDPVTHQPVPKEIQTSETSSPHNELGPMSENNLSQAFESTNNSGISKENPSFPQSRNSSSVDDEPKNLFQTLCDDEKMLSYLLGDNEPLLLDASNWELPDDDKRSKNCKDVLSSWDDCTTWLMDCQDFGVNDFGLDFLK
ncbi:hypothetical protein M8C21_014219 [Ambrosia artemisiifolia]|uniref:Uncharacterized protein n=1 Tax=Ambrosia artemisiifolia TaxID=4212 RepID=A0AAD5CM65_AMBAR|nr:hypothetical protein M8C21_014219 [Ambrosia artemisiifolia]